MHPFSFIQAETSEAAIAALSANAQASFFAGGTTLLDLMKLDVLAPTHLVDVSRLPFSEIAVSTDSITIGANVRNSDLAQHPAIRRHFPVLSEALLAGASAQLRNMATTAGNLLQRTRCCYFRDPVALCNKRTPGSGCAALHGVNSSHAILGVSEHCIATHPSDMCVALVMLDAAIQTLLPSGRSRTLPVAGFHLLPGATPHLETLLEHAELITHIHLPITALAANSHYLKVRDRASYEFALASAAVALSIDNGIVSAARVALGGIATRPWRSPEAEAALLNQPASHATFLAAANAALAAAQPQSHNAFKIDLARQTLILALEQLTKGEN
jgi:xanthine dehydrogenase YagS FAD-binding subunit